MEIHRREESRAFLQDFLSSLGMREEVKRGHNKQSATDVE